MAETIGARAAAVPEQQPPQPPSASVPRASRSWALVHTAALTAAAVGVLLLGALAGRVELAALMFPLQVLLVLAWLAALDTQGLVGAAVIGVGSAAAADAFTVVGPIGASRLAAVVAVALLVALCQQLSRQLTRQGARPGLTMSLAATLTAVAIAVGFALLVALRRTDTGRIAVTTSLVATGAALVVARGTDAVRLRRAASDARRRGWLGLVLAGAVAVGIGVVFGAARSALGIADGISLASAAAAVALAADIGLDVARGGLAPGQEADRTRAALLPLSVLLPIAAAAPAAYVTGRVLVG